MYGVLGPTTIDGVLDSFQEYLRIAHPANAVRFERLRAAARESALAEAVVFQLLEQIGVKPQINDSVASGGPDFICSGGYQSPVLRRFATPDPSARFLVEATSFDLDAVTRQSAIPREIEDARGGPFRLLTSTIRGKASEKAPQLAGHEMARILAITSSHAGAAALFNTATAAWCLTSNPGIQVPHGGGPGTPVTNLSDSVFLKPGSAGANIEACRKSISAVLLISVHGNHSRVLGILHPEAAWPLDYRLLPTIHFVRLAKWPIADGIIETEWVIGDPEPHKFLHMRVRLPEHVRGGILLNGGEQGTRSNPDQGAPECSST